MEFLAITGEAGIFYAMLNKYKEEIKHLALKPESIKDLDQDKVKEMKEYFTSSLSSNTNYTFEEFISRVMSGEICLTPSYVFTPQPLRLKDEKAKKILD